MQTSDRQKKNIHSYRLTDETVKRMVQIGTKLYNQQNPLPEVPGAKRKKISDTKALELCIDTMYKYMTVGQPLFLEI